MRAQHRVRLPALQPAPIERLGVPGRSVQEVLQPLTVGTGHDGRQFHHRLVVLAGQQQANQRVAESDALLRTAEQIVELGTEAVNRRGGGRRRLCAASACGRWACVTSNRQLVSDVGLLTSC